MKKLFLLTAIVLSFSGVSIGQSGSDENSNCYIKWAKKFETRGANEVTNGTHAYVIISVRRGSGARCFVGKCDVKDGKVIAMYRKLEDGSYELYKPKIQIEFAKQPVTITNGMSKTVPTMDGELINVLFIKNIKPKKAGYEEAPNPDDF